MSLESVRVICPYCGESIEVDVEPLEESQTYIEDCSVCCRPMQLTAYPVRHYTDGGRPPTTQWRAGEDGLEVVATRSD